jgi:deoxyribonuclease-1-like protein
VRIRWIALLAVIAVSSLVFRVPTPPDQPNEHSAEPPATTLATRHDTIRIASFNIQAFGQSKLAKPHVMRILADTIRRFDVVAIQEVRSKEQDVLPRLVAEINADGSAYQFVIGPRLGRTSSKEQYAFVYDSRTVIAQPESAETLPDPGDRLHREPFVTRFRAAGGGTGPAFTFLLVNVHTDPDEVDSDDPESEINVLADFYDSARRNRWREDDVILLGDLNADYTHLGRLGRVPNLTVALGDQTTNARRNKQYDQLLFDGRATAEFTGHAGVEDLQRSFGLTLEQVLEVSDHLPVWAEFSSVEAGPIGPFASRSGVVGSR